MSIKVYKANEWSELSELNRYTNGKWSPLKTVKRMNAQGEWELIWSNTVTHTFSIIGTQSYRHNGIRDSAADTNSYIEQGFDSSGIGHNVLLLLPLEEIQSFLSGASNITAELQAKRIDTGGAATAYLRPYYFTGTTDPLSRWNGVTNTVQAVDEFPAFASGECKWITLDRDVGIGLKYGTITALVLSVGNSLDESHHMLIEKSSVKLRLNYKK